ncbi:MAG: FkbM family methyltransferase [Butyrivibrio sp.]|nr:FkbM family methyltransferase [Butyrivibrio sp.]
MKKKAVIWGMGGTARYFLNKKGFYRDFEIIALTDNNPEMWHKEYCGFKVIEPSELLNMAYDYIIICSVHILEIRKQLEENLSVEHDKILTSFEIDDNIKNKVLEKYASVQDEEIQDVIGYFKDKGLNVYGSYVAAKQDYLVYRDEEQHPYIMFENKRMYFPDTYSFLKMDGKEFVDDVLYEQKERSPHQYICKKDDIKQNSVIVDGGVCEGNFALSYIDKAKKIYLIEADGEWMQALKRTFQPYRDKVVFCQKFLTRYDSANTVTLDSLVSEKIDFLKMDIEGAEIDALLGGRKTLQRSNARCAVCSYHKQNDEENIRYILESYGYRTQTSKGYIFFAYDENIVDTLDLRRGVVYGYKTED